MKKLIGLFNTQDNDKGVFYNFYPVKVLTDEYDYGSGIYEIDWGPYVDTEIGDLFDQYRNINISCNKLLNNNEYIFEDAESMFYPRTWGIVDLQFIAKNIAYTRGRSKCIPFIAIRNENISVTDNDCCIVLGRRMVEENFYDAALAFSLSEDFYIKESEKQLTGPYKKVDDDRYVKAENFGTWELKKEPEFLYCYIPDDNTSESYDIQMILKEDIVSVNRIVVSNINETASIAVDESIKTQDEKFLNDIPVQVTEEIEASNDLITTVNAEALMDEDRTVQLGDDFVSALHKYNAFFPEQYELPKVTTFAMPKSKDDCKAKEFKRDIESIKGTEALKAHILSELYRYNVVTQELMTVLTISKHVSKVGVCFNQLMGQGYLSHVELDTLGDYYCASKKMIKAYGHSTVCKFLNVKNNSTESLWVNNDNPKNCIAHLAYAKVATNVMQNTSNERIIFNDSSDSFIVSYVDKSGHWDASIGIFDSPSEYTPYIEERMKAIFNGDNIPVRLFIAGIDYNHAAAQYDAVKYYFKDKVPAAVYEYSLTDNKYYAANTGEETSIEDVWSNDIVAKFEEERRIAEAKAKFEEAEKEKATIEQKEKEAAEEKAKAALEAEKEAQLRIEQAKQAVIDAEQKIKAVTVELRELEQRRDSVKRSLDAEESNVESLRKQTSEIVKNARKAIESPEFARVTIDGYLASHMMKAAGEWESGEKTKNYIQYSKELFEAEEPSVESVKEYVIEKIRKARPTYDHNEIANIAMCIAQGFLTVFSGAPGSGKTSICNLFARVLGLDLPFEDYEYLRYVPISVGRGWTSQRDFIGYYNPLSKEFDTNNNQAFDIFKIGDAEYGNSKYPLVVLLDEANLSPMEYYWSEFIRMCDDRSKYNTINCGGKETFRIPETMRFLATINNDDTTTTLSPRLIDRAWVVTLPKLKPEDLLEKSDDFIDGELNRITWTDFINTFGPRSISSEDEHKIMELLKSIVDIVPGININNRVYTSIRDYYSSAKDCFINDNNGSCALDYAIAQRILPKIGGVDGQGDTYGRQLKELQEFFIKNNYSKSADLVREIIERGSDIGYYQFF